MKTVAIIQARMGSSRLQNKMLLFLHGYPICEWIFRRVKQARYLDKVIFAIPDGKNDDVLDQYLQSKGADVLRGSENDLVDRYYKAVKYTAADQIVRVCADNPLICGSEIDRLIGFYGKERCDYAYNHIPRHNSYPDGLGAEICSRELIEEIYKNAEGQQQREHLFNYIWDYQANYIVKTFDPPGNIAHPELKFDLDTIDDYAKLLRQNYQIGMSAEELIQESTIKYHENKRTVL